MRRAQYNEQAQAAVVAAARRQVEAARGALTAAQANLVNPAMRSAQVAAVQGQIAQARADVVASQAEAGRARAQLLQGGGWPAVWPKVVIIAVIGALFYTVAWRGMRRMQLQS